MNPIYGPTERKEFLFHMYDQLCSEISRQINIIWQALGILLSTFAIYALVEKQIIPLDVATAIILAVACVNIAIVIESNFWYNRNLVMIANIERQFLYDSDLKDIHSYFAKHRSKNAYLDMMLIQIIFAIIIIGIVIWYHIANRVLPNFHEPVKNFDPVRSLPYLILTIGIIWLYIFHRKRIANYNDFVANSPGILLDPNITSKIKSNSDHITLDNIPNSGL